MTIKRINPVIKKNVLHALSFRMKDYTPREETFEGRKYLVAPVTFMLEGVHHGSGGAIYYSDSELSKFPEAWNGIPLPVYHPTDNKGRPISANSPKVLELSSVGYLFNTKHESPSLKGEVWIDVLKAEDKHPEVLKRVQDGEQIEVSTGVFTEDEFIKGNWNGEHYEAIAHNLRPDHLAILPNEIGACSCEDGCGIRANSNGKFNKHQLLGLTANAEEHFMKIGNQIAHILDNWDNEEGYWSLEELGTNSFIAAKRSWNSRGQNIRTLDITLFRYSYTVNATGAVTVGETGTEVYRDIKYTDKPESVIANKGKEIKTDMKLVDIIIANAHTQFVEADREMLNNQTDDFLKKLIPVVAEVEPTTPAVEPVANKAQAIDLLKEELADPNKFMNLIPVAVRDQINYGLSIHNNKKAELVKTIVDNSTFTSEMLENKDIPELTALAALAQPKKVATFLGNSTGFGSNPVTNTTIKELPLVLPSWVKK